MKCPGCDKEHTFQEWMQMLEAEPAFLQELAGMSLKTLVAAVHLLENPTVTALTPEGKTIPFREIFVESVIDKVFQEGTPQRFAFDLAVEDYLKEVLCN